MDLEHAITTFLFYLGANGYSVSTREIYKWALTRMCEFLQNPELKRIKADDIERFWMWLRNDYQPRRMNGNTDPLSGRSLENIWTAERTFWGWAVATDKIRKRPDTGIRKPKYAEREVQPFTQDEVNRMLDHTRRTRAAATEKRTPFTMPRPTAKRDTAIIMLLADTGMRVSECARLERADIVFEKRELTIRAWGTGRKTRERTLELGKQTVLAVWEYLMLRESREKRQLLEDDYIFVTLRGRPMNKDSIRGVITEIGNAAGVEGAHPHRFRHTYASEMAADDMGEEALKYNLGQTTGKMVHRYTHLHKRRQRKHVSVVDRIRRK